MSLTLVGHALSCLAEHSSHARLPATRRGPVLRPIDQRAVSGYNSHQTAGYSCLPVTLCDVALNVGG